MRVTVVLGSKTLCFRRYTHHVMSISDNMSASVSKSNEVLYLKYPPYAYRLDTYKVYGCSMNV